MRINIEAVKARIGFKPTAWQADVLSNLKRFTKIVGGKRSGKSFLSSYLAFRELLASDREIWIVAPTYELGTRVWDNLVKWSMYYPSILKVRKQDPIHGRSIENLAQGSVLRLKSTDNPKQLKGAAGDLLIVEEAGDIDDDVWADYLEPFISERRPALGGEKGRAVFIGNASFKGSWFHQHWQRKGKEDVSFWIPTAIEENGEIVASNNPEWIDVEELKRIKDNSTEKTWREQWIAEWRASAGEVFRNVLDCATGVFQSPRDKFYYIGIDLGRLQDYSVITVVDSESWDVVYWDRFKEIEYPFQKEKILGVIDKFGRYNTKIHIDQTGLGQPIVDDLQRENLNVEGFTFTSESKKDLIEKLSLLLEHKKIRYPEIKELIDELQVFGFEVMPKTKRIRYSAPSGYHDDCVISLALAVMNLAGEPKREDVKPMSFKEGLEVVKNLKTRQMFSKEERPKIIRPHV